MARSDYKTPKEGHEKSIPFPGPAPFYRSGLWRQNTFAWLSPDAVTATDASLKDKCGEWGDQLQAKYLIKVRSFVASGYLLMVKSRISAVWPRYSDTMLPERASHNRSAPSRQQVDTTEEDSSQRRLTMPAWWERKNHDIFIWYAYEADSYSEEAGISGGSL